MPSTQDVAWALKLPEKVVKSYLDDLIASGLFTIDESGDVTPHDWDELQFESDTSRARQKAYRDRHAQRNRDVTVTVQEQSRADTEQIQSRAEGVRFPDSRWKLDPEFGKFREGYISTGAATVDLDWADGYFAWVRLDFEQKAMAINAIVSFCGDPAFLKRPRKYLETHEFRRPIVIPTRKARSVMEGV